MDEPELVLTALLCTRICHDLVGPVGAIGAGLEVLEDEDDGELQRQALDLLNMSAGQAAAKLKFYRAAFGTAGTSTGAMPIDEARGLALALFDGGRTELNWPAPVPGATESLVGMHAKLLLNMVLMASEALPRGGRVTVEVSSPPEAAILSVEATGANAHLSESAERALLETAVARELEPRSANVYLTQRIAKAVGDGIQIDRGEGRIGLRVTPPSSN